MTAPGGAGAAAPTPRRCLAAADQLLRGAGALGATAVTGGWWPRACACLIRLALEGGIDAYWRQVKPPVASCRQGRAKQLMLRGRLGPGIGVARRVAFTWATLSTAAHHHCYELAPTAAELRRLHTEVSVLLTQLDRRTDPER
ncbi:hypothetical protein DKT69_34120 [Micromonospora sicca]|uniref:Uncharacterized protein n=1 Tax=Micromonospora sicca TaxID=2202420 RepID=A0A317D1S4_9ACTN|nr:hypothetical protein [Micromonospora sp. 4G51]PWR07786.1 hypothetical protein DKT69_34120 [Micromonospora sp. 4G51]